EVQFNKDSFEQQFHYSVFYSWLRLKEQEIRNVIWVAEYISQKQKDKINNNYTSIY
ncbi:H(+)-transporting V0 sector ATPase subunit d, partial [Coemansia sp. S146]